MAATKKFNRIVLCIDGSQHAEHAFQYYKDIMHRPETEVYLIHVSDRAYVSGMHLESEGIEVDTEDMRKRLVLIEQTNEDLRKKYKDKCEEAQFTYRIKCLPGDEGIGVALVDFVRENNINVIVMGSRGLGKIRRTLMGSVSDYVIHHCDIPVLICPAKVAGS